MPILTYERTDQIVPDTAILACGTHQSNLGCVSPSFTADSVDVQCLGTQLSPVPWRFETLLEIHGPSYSLFMSEPPPPAVCATFKTQGCAAGLMVYVSYNGAVVHECAHRVVDEKFVEKLFDDLLTALREIQADLLFCSGACSCETPAIQEKVQKALDRTAGRIRKRFHERTTKQMEAPAEAVECQYYVSKCP